MSANLWRPFPKLPRPFPKLPRPLRKVPRPLRKVPRPLRKVPRPLRKVPRSLRKVSRESREAGEIVQEGRPCDPKFLAFGRKAAESGQHNGGPVRLGRGCRTNAARSAIVVDPKSSSYRPARLTIRCPRLTFFCHRKNGRFGGILSLRGESRNRGCLRTPNVASIGKPTSRRVTRHQSLATQTGQASRSSLVTINIGNHAKRNGRCQK
jgi:hypothetical protein